MSGGIGKFQNYDRYLHDLHIFHAMLCGPRYKFKPSDVRVLYANGGTFDFGGNRVQAELASAANLTTAIDDAINGIGWFSGGKLGSDDLLLFMSTNHGDSSKPPHRLLLWDPSEYFESDDFAAAVTPAFGCYFLAIFGHCFGGDMFLKTLAAIGGSNKAVCVAASTSASYALEPDNGYDAFIYHLTSALAGKTPANYTADADANGDGFVDIQEAFDFATRMDKTKDVPSIDDAGSGIKLKMTLDGVI